jgi:hypothetical protein
MELALSMGTALFTGIGPPMETALFTETGPFMETGLSMNAPLRHRLAPESAA